MEKIINILENLYKSKIITDYEIKRNRKIVDYSFKCSTDTIDLDCYFDEVEKIETFIKEYIDDYDKWCESVANAM
ncbi:MAG: hypothetical protein HUJ87_14995 [Fusobacterium varium]|uniref:hypothetical protein n=1 Tax=Fusobacterium varium TaxID=856 RepID=UPI00242FB73E|nr:hypothetical protein [Fusobacterium varium]MCF0171799.1 hypothetical protein [Fusobacterium varium]